MKCLVGSLRGNVQLQCTYRPDVWAVRGPKQSRLELGARPRPRFRRRRTPIVPGGAARSRWLSFAKKRERLKKKADAVISFEGDFRRLFAIADNPPAGSCIRALRVLGPADFSSRFFHGPKRSGKAPVPRIAPGRTPFWGPHQSVNRRQPFVATQHVRQRQNTITIYLPAAGRQRRGEKACRQPPTFTHRARAQGHHFSGGRGTSGGPPDINRFSRRAARYRDPWRAGKTPTARRLNRTAARRQGPRSRL